MTRVGAGATIVTGLVSPRHGWGTVRLPGFEFLFGGDSDLDLLCSGFHLWQLDVRTDRRRFITLLMFI